MEFKVIGEVENLSVSYYAGGISVVAKEGLIGLADKHGKVIINQEYNALDIEDEGVVAAKCKNCIHVYKNGLLAAVLVCKPGTNDWQTIGIGEGLLPILKKERVKRGSV